MKDTAYEVRRARNQGIFVIGIFVGNEEELSVEKRIYGKDLAYIRNISNFSRMVGTFLRRQIDMELGKKVREKNTQSKIRLVTLDYSKKSCQTVRY